MKALLLVLVVAGCSDDLCVDGACADPSETRAFAGPCASRSHTTNRFGAEFVVTGQFGYNADGRLTTVTVTHDDTGSPPDSTKSQTVSETHWTYDAAGEVSAIDGPNLTWRFDPQHVTLVDRDGTSVYDRATFAFLPQPGLGSAVPFGWLGLQTTSGGSTCTWTGTDQTRTKTCVGSATEDTTTAIFTLDAQGRIVDAAFPNSIGSTPHRSFTFAGANLVDDDNDGRHTRYSYDEGGNLIEVVDELQPDAHEVYTYGCWN